ncbi:hypothetical protein EJ05DRAFT_498949 [Pseudovirgaria hyperparasitica]|uniref:Xylanolytic transcriptional activator regulatory domain-containing protein n=1 Tax=Pseudovirgaria hyperparasitica TaxID=470096 RepID=A0A6A6WD19_9PEZI|nr:uncharacterized protein EJ05DRAFT_498949 [Pseudovirgaria hyperparasitica]KAF2759746.1 hypothetical protein EJ05DRAFT_498949 [Pseudovirgaria hyperparasitica]
MDSPTPLQPPANFNTGIINSQSFSFHLALVSALNALHASTRRGQSGRYKPVAIFQTSVQCLQSKKGGRLLVKRGVIINHITTQVRCDKASPCSSCKASNIPCKTSNPEPKAPRKRLHVTEEYERKIDFIQERLADLDHVFHSGENTRYPAPSSSSSLTQVPKTSPRAVSRAAYASPLSADDLTKEERQAYEGETSMRAHSAYARDLLEKAVQEDPFAASSPAMSSALAHLRQLSSRHEPTPGTVPPARLGGDSRFDYRRLKLPPTDVVLNLLRQAKISPTLTFLDPFAVLDIDQLTELCKDVFFCLDNYPTSTAILVFGHLYWLGCDSSGGRLGYDIERGPQSSLCKDNLEIALSNLEVLSPGNENLISALLFGACYAIETCRPTMSWKLTAAAASAALSMGWHRMSEDDTDQQRRRKAQIFWYIYVMDRSISLRFGRAAILQDYDIDVDLPDYGSSPVAQYSTKVVCLWIRTARVQGRVYEQLYSPAALKQSREVQKNHAKLLLHEIETVREEIPQLYQHHESLNLPDTIAGIRAVKLLCISDEVVVNVVCCMIARSSSDAGLSPDCLGYARAALALHQKAADSYVDIGEDSWSLYIHWTILQAPFVPFIVLFGNVLSTQDAGDLQRMEKFVQTLAMGQTTEGSRKMHALCSTLHQVANLYVEGHSQSNTPSSAPDQAVNISSQAWSALNPYLNTMGFAGGPSVDSNVVMNNSIGDWWNGNQYMMGLLEDDTLGYLN